MEATHHRTGTKALLSYNVSKGPELSNPIDLDPAPTGNTYFVLTEIYETEAGVADHFQHTTASWKDFLKLSHSVNHSISFHLSRCRLQPAYDVLHQRGEINVIMHHLPAPCFSAIDS